jgi:hypothetical protein
MAKWTAEQGGLEGWLYRLGYASARIGDVLQSARDAASGAADRASDAAGDLVDEVDDRWHDDDEEPGSLREHAGSLAATTAVGALVAYLLRPHKVNWPRAILAGTIGTLLYDAETVVESRLRQRKFGTRPGAGGFPPLGDIRAHLGRYAAGIGMAGFYAQFLYGRLPGPPVVQGAVYGLLESATRGWGGPVALLNRLSPEIPVPSGYTHGIAHGTETAFERARRHLLFGAALGLVYRNDSDE